MNITINISIDQSTLASNHERFVDNDIASMLRALFTSDDYTRNLVCEALASKYSMGISAYSDEKGVPPSTGSLIGAKLNQADSAYAKIHGR